MAKNQSHLFDQGPNLIDKWGASYSSARIGVDYEWYALVKVLAFQGIRYDLEDVDPDEVQTVTIALGNFTAEELVNNFEEIILEAVNRYGLTLAHASVIASVVITWRKQ